MKSQVKKAKNDHVVVRQIAQSIKTDLKHHRDQHEFLVTSTEISLVNVYKRIRNHRHKYRRDHGRGRAQDFAHARDHHHVVIPIDSTQSTGQMTMGDV
jgi:hypothetical protein